MKAELETFVETLQAQMNTKYTQYRVYLDEISERTAYARICATLGNYPHVIAFVALRDGKTKTLGEYKKGDIFYPAGWSGPAKIARGNLFNEDKGIGATNGKGGIKTLR